MKTWQTISIALPVFLLGAVAYLPLTAAQDDKPIEQRIAEAKTPADHEAIAAYYEKQAQEAHQQHALHQQFSKSYSAVPVLKTKTGAVAHCNTIAKKYEDIAKEYEALAKMHREMGKAPK
jgi:hypothetical protein